MSTATEKPSPLTHPTSDVTNNSVNANVLEATTSSGADQQIRVVAQVEAFGQYVTSRLLNTGDKRKRRKLELYIQSAIVKIESKNFEDDE